jgi:hypothetical protein
MLSHRKRDDGAQDTTMKWKKCARLHLLQLSQIVPRGDLVIIFDDLSFRGALSSAGLRRDAPSVSRTVASISHISCTRGSSQSSRGLIDFR